jgi:hypothetical protein
VSLQVLLSPLRGPASPTAAPLETAPSASFSLPIPQETAPTPEGAYLFSEASDPSDLAPSSGKPSLTPPSASAKDGFLAQLIGASLPELAAAALPADAHDPNLACEVLPEAPELPVPSAGASLAPQAAWGTLGVPDTEFPGLSPSALPLQQGPHRLPQGPAAELLGQPLVAVAPQLLAPTTPAQAPRVQPNLVDGALELVALLANSLPRAAALARPQGALPQSPAPTSGERPQARPAAKSTPTAAALKVLSSRTPAAPVAPKPSAALSAALPLKAPPTGPLRTFSETPWLEVLPEAHGDLTLEPESARPLEADRLGSAAQLARSASSARSALAEAAPFRATAGPTPELSAPVPHDLELEVQQGADSLRLSLSRGEEGYHLSLRGSSLLLQDPTELHSELDRALRQDAEQGLASFDAHADDSPEEDPEADSESPPEESSDPSRLLDRRV